MSPPRIPSAIRAPTSAEPRVQKSIGNNELGRTLLNFGHSMSNEAMPMQIAGPGNRAIPCTLFCQHACAHSERPFETALLHRRLRKRLSSPGFYSHPKDAAQFYGVGNIKPHVGMSILLASIQITIPRAHRCRLSSILKTPSRRRGSPGYFSYQTNGLPHLAHGIRTHIVATQQKTTRKKRPAKTPKPAENTTMGPPCREIVPNCQKTPQGGLFLGSP